MTYDLKLKIGRTYNKLSALNEFTLTPIETDKMRRIRKIIEYDNARKNKQANIIPDRPSFV